MDNGTSPLFIAALNEHADIVQILLDHNADITLTFNTNANSLRDFASRRPAEVQAKMNTYIANQPDAEDIRMTAAEIASVMGHDDIASLLQQKRPRLA